MKATLRTEIEERGFWRINFRPLNYPDQKLSLKDSEDLVRRNTVERRGWDYPHYPTRNDEESGLVRANGYVEGWIDWGPHREFWRLYGSTQFLHYRAITTDWSGGHQSIFNLSRTEQWTSREIGVLDLWWQLTEFFEFLKRLNASGVYPDGAVVSIALKNTERRRLLNQREIPYAIPTISGHSDLVLIETYTVDQVQDAFERAVTSSIHFSELFGLDAPRDQVEYQIKRFYELRLGGHG